MPSELVERMVFSVSWCSQPRKHGPRVYLSVTSSVQWDWATVMQMGTGVGQGGRWRGAAHEGRGMKSSMAEVAVSSADYIGTPRTRGLDLGSGYQSFSSSPVPERTCRLQT